MARSKSSGSAQVTLSGSSGCHHGATSPRTVELVATSLRSFFRFLRAEGLAGDRLDDGVPMVPHRRSGLVRHLDPGSLERADRLPGFVHRAADLRDRAMILCMSRLGLRVSEIVRLRLEDIDWRARVIRVAGPQDWPRGVASDHRRGRSGAGRLSRSRPPRHHGPGSVRAGQDPAVALRSVTASSGGPWTTALRPGRDRSGHRGGNLLRHSLATGLQARGCRFERDRRPARAQLSGHDPDLCRGRYRGPAPGGAAMAGVRHHDRLGEGVGR